jgi:hypothetical protein
VDPGTVGDRHASTRRAPARADADRRIPRATRPALSDERPSPVPAARRRSALAVLAGTVLVAGLVALTGAGGGLLGPAAPPGGGDGPTPATAGASDHVGASSEGYRVWERQADGSPVRWDPCSPIELVVAPAGAPPGADRDLAVAVERLRDATGLDLRVVGTTDERPSGARLPYQPERYGDRWAPVLVAWAEPHEDGVPLRDIDRGVGIPVAVGTAGDRTYVSGQVVLNAARTDLVAGFEDRATSWGATLLHELAHVLGLDHVDDPAELMAVHPGEGPVAFGPGDRAGLRAVGADGGCRPVPTPQPVVVDPTGP